MVDNERDSVIGSLQDLWQTAPWQSVRFEATASVSTPLSSVSSFLLHLVLCISFLAVRNAGSKEAVITETLLAQDSSFYSFQAIQRFSCLQILSGKDLLTRLT